MPKPNRRRESTSCQLLLHTALRGTRQVDTAEGHGEELLKKFREEYHFALDEHLKKFREEEEKNASFKLAAIEEGFEKELLLLREQNTQQQTAHERQL